MLTENFKKNLPKMKCNFCSPNRTLDDMLSTGFSIQAPPAAYMRFLSGSPERGSFCESKVSCPETKLNDPGRQCQTRRTNH